MSKPIRVRYAPSPTGLLHIGNARTALFNYLYARHHGGDFIIRIEDTDRKRHVEDGERSQLENLKWLGMDWDESPETHENYRQSERLELYQKYIDQLLADGKAYKSYVTEEELATERERQEAAGKALFGGQGGLFVMSTDGQGTLLANSFGSIKKITLEGGTMTIDNAHVVAWSRELDYDIHLENGFMQSIGTGEGVVNTFRGHGEVYIQSLNLEQFAGSLKRYLPTNSN